MTETEVEAQAIEPAYCRHCGAFMAEPPQGGADWQCPECERYQNTVQCPTCKNPTSVGSLPADMVPKAHAPQKRGKEG